MRFTFLLALLASAAPALRAQPVTYPVYVDAAGGDDAHDGRTPATAWKSLDRVNAETFGPGARILFGKGGRWTGALAPGGSGSAEAPVRIGAYGSGAAPTLDGEGKVFAVVQLTNQEYWEIEDLDITNFEGNPPASPRRKLGVYALGRDAGAVRHIVLRRLTIHDINGPLDDELDSQSRYYGGVLFEVTGNTIPTWFDGILVEDCRLTDVDRSGISTRSSWENRSSTSRFGEEVAPGARDNWTPSLNVVIRRNTLERIGGNGVYLRVAKAPLAEYNHVVRAGLKISGNAFVCFNTDDALFQYNDVGYTVFNREGEASYNHRDDTDAGGIDSDFRTKRTVIQYNYLHHNGEGGVVVTGGPGGETTYERFNLNTVVRYNILDRNNRVGIHLSGRAANTLFYNNTVYTDASNANVNLVDYTAWSGAWPEGDRYYNNIFFHGGSSPDYVLGSARSIDFERNLYGGIVSATEPASDSTALHAGDVFTLFVGPYDAPEGFRLLAGAPGLGAGIRPASFFTDGQPVRDYFGTPIPPTAPLDLGAAQRTVTTGLGDAEPGPGSASLKVFPNPASGPVQIRYTAAGAEPVRIVVYDLTGREVMRLEGPPGRSEISLDPANLAGGMYIVYVQTAGGVLGMQPVVFLGGAR